MRFWALIICLGAVATLGTLAFFASDPSIAQRIIYFEAMGTLALVGIIVAAAIAAISAERRATTTGKRGGDG